MMHLWLWKNVTGLNALICHETQATHTHTGTHTGAVACWLNETIPLLSDLLKQATAIPQIYL